MRPYELKKKTVCLVGQSHTETYSDMVKRLTEEDSLAYGQNHRQVAARIKNAVAMVSDVNVGAGSDMFMLSSYLAFSISDVYATIDKLDMSDSAKTVMANEMKKLEETPSQFAAARKLQQIEARRQKMNETIKIRQNQPEEEEEFDDGKDPA